LLDGWAALALKHGMRVGTQGLQGSAGNYVKFLLASTAGCRQLTRLTAEAGSQAGMADCAMDPQAETVAEEVHLHFMSHCEHHMLPFHGVLHVAYVPGSSGQSLSAKTMQSLLRTYSRRLQIQERLTQQITDAVHRTTGVMTWT
jgi:GTP cyclohydrolase I